MPTSPDYTPLYGSFPNPPLKVFHWDVFSHCKENFSTCLRFIYETSVDSYLQYSTDSAIIIKKQNWTRDKDQQHIETVDQECKKLVELDKRTMQPFKGPLERFQWRTTASYYLCHYTMLEVEELKHFKERCDDYAQCTWDDFVFSNGDYRADDRIPFQCAKYSFCPDPCCQSNRLLSIATEQEQCQKNPCVNLQNKSCNLDPQRNQNFVAMIYNEWNVSCVCDQPSGYQWKSRYGMCVDYDECANQTICDNVSETCFNTPGNYVCACSYGHTWSTAKNQCRENERLTYATKRFGGIATPEEGRATTCHRLSLTVIVMCIASISITHHLYKG